MSLDIFLKEKPLDYNGDSKTLYHDNITHNLNRMATEAGIYEVLWRPDEHNYIQAKDIKEKLIEGFHKLLNGSEHYKKFNPDNGWGTYEGFLEFCFEYIKAINKYPESYIYVDR